MRINLATVSSSVKKQVLANSMSVGSSQAVRLLNKRESALVAPTSRGRENGGGHSRKVVLALLLAIACFGAAVSAAELRGIEAGRDGGVRVSESSSPFVMKDGELAIRGRGSSVGRATPDGVLWVEDRLATDDDDVRVRVRLRDEDPDGSVGLGMVGPDGRWYLARVGADGPELVRSSGRWTSIERAHSPVSSAGSWMWLEIELGREGAQRRWSVRAWPEAAERPAEAGVVAHENLSDAQGELIPAIWSNGDGSGHAADLEVHSLTTIGNVPEAEGWPIEAIGDRVDFADPRIDDSRISMAAIDVKHSAPLVLEEQQLKTTSSFPCNPYQYRFMGAAPSYPGSNATIGLPPVDHDCDGLYNEDGVNGVDDDGDGLVDEDPSHWADWLLNWSSEDSRHGAVASGDVAAAILTIRRTWPSYKKSIIFATVFGGPEYVLAGAVRIAPDPAGIAKLVGANGFVTYLLVEAASEPLEAEIMESGVPLINGQSFARAVVFSADVTGGTPPTTAAATIDGSPHTLGDPYDVDGSHAIRVEVNDSAGGQVNLERNFTVDRTPPGFSEVQPASGTVVGTAPVVITGLVSADAVEVTVAGLTATLDPPAGDTRGFTSESVDLAEGLNTIDLSATDDFGHSGSAQLTLTLDTLAPVVAISTPPNGTLTTIQPLAVTGTVVESNLTGITVNGVPATVTGNQFTAEVGLTEGSNTIEAIATDDFGRTGSASVTVILDTTAPGAFITDPTTGIVTDAAAVPVSGTYDEPLVLVTVNGLSTTFGAGSFSVVAVPLDNEGDNLIVATATDLAGNTADSPPVLVVRDTQAPIVSMDTTSLPTLTSIAALTVSGSAIDPHLASVTVAGQPATIIGEQWTVDLTLVEGVNEIVAVAEDTLGHSAQSAPFPVSLDTNPPVVSIIDPVDGASFTSTTVLVEGTVTDPHLDGTAVTVNGSAATVTGENFSVELEVVEGESILVAQAADQLGHVGTSVPVAVIVDTLAPVVTLADPLQPLVSTPTVEVTGTVADPHLDTVEIAGVHATVVGSQFTAAGIPLIEGSNLLTATATDTFGHTAQSNEVEYLLDTMSPEITITSPVEGELVPAATVTVTGTATDDHLGTVVVNGVAATIDGSTFTAENVPLNEGVTELTAVAEDFLDHTTTATVTVLSDTAAPGVAIVSPATGACVPAGQPVSVVGSVYDVNLSDGLGGNPPPVELEITTTEGVQVSYPAVVAAGGRNWSVDGVDPGTVDGTAILSVVAHDSAGRTGVASGSLRVDATPPVLTLLLDGSAFPGAAPGSAPPPGAVPALLNRIVSARVTVSDGAYGAPEATLTVDGLPVRQYTSVPSAFIT